MSYRLHILCGKTRHKILLFLVTKNGCKFWIQWNFTYMIQSLCIVHDCITFFGTRFCWYKITDFYFMHIFFGIWSYLLLFWAEMSAHEKAIYLWHSQNRMTSVMIEKNFICIFVFSELSLLILNWFCIAARRTLD